MSELTLYLVCGYGCHLTEKLERFLQVVAREVKEAQAPTLVLTSGGYTAQRSAPGVSEAALMSQRLKELGVHWPIMMDRGARTTLENLRGCAELIERLPAPPARLVIFCDAIRQAKVARAASVLLPLPTTLHPVTFGRNLLQTAVQTQLAPAYDETLLRVPALEQMGLWLVELRMRLS